jgi:hypothetical protein
VSKEFVPPPPGLAELELRLLRETLDQKRQAEPPAQTAPENARYAFSAETTICTTCGGPFKRRRAWERFCSTPCRRAGQAKEATENERDARRYRWYRANAGRFDLRTSPPEAIDLIIDEALKAEAKR